MSKLGFMVSCRIICSDCGINTDLHYCFQKRQKESDDEIELYDFALCSNCIKEREKDDN